MSVYAFADIHGNYELFKKIKEFLKPEDTCYVLGDCADRGDDGWQIIKEVYENPKFIYLKGNHEQLLCKAMKEDTILCIPNYGEKTYLGWTNDGRDISWGDKLEQLPSLGLYVNNQQQYILLSHAGFTFHSNLNPKEISEDFLLWDRGHFQDKWDENFYNTYIVHGHTPYTILFNEFPKTHPSISKIAAWYCEDKGGRKHKVDIDCNSAVTNYIVLLDLDTFEEHLFEI